MTRQRTGARPRRRSLYPERFAQARVEARTRDRLVADNLGLAERIAVRFAGRGEELDDLIQVARLGLLKAIDRFDPSRGVRFVTYATPTIVGELKRYFRDAGWSLRIPRALQERALAVRDAMADLPQQLGRPPTPTDVAHHLSISEEDVLEALETLDSYSSHSLDAPLGGDLENDSVADMMGEDDPELETALDVETLRPHLRELPDRERRILYLRYVEDWSQSRIGNDIGISQMHVSRLLSKTVDELRASVAG